MPLNEFRVVPWHCQYRIDMGSKALTNKSGYCACSIISDQVYDLLCVEVRVCKDAYAFRYLEA